MEPGGIVSTSLWGGRPRRSGSIAGSGSSTVLLKGHRGALSTGVKRPSREADHSLRPEAAVRSYLSPSLIFVLWLFVFRTVRHQTVNLVIARFPACGETLGVFYK